MTTAPTARRARPINPFAPARPAYVDDLVEVSAAGPVRPRRTLGMVRTDHFDLRHDELIRLTHRVGATDLHAGLAGLLAEELFGPGWLRGSELFERILTGIVLSSRTDPLEAWELFYRNSLREIATATGGEDDSGLHGSITGYAPVYGHAEELLRGDSVLELGSCFGFFSLRQVATRRVTAVDLSPGTVRLLHTISPRLGPAVDALTADAAHVPLPDAYADTVVALHLLEHQDPEHGDRVLADAIRMARRRVVVAVPFEDEPEETWGHLRTFNLDDLATWARHTRLPHDVHEHHGGWLILDLDRG